MSILKSGVLMAASVAIATLGFAQTTQAGTLHGGWNYGIDAFGDGSGGSVYDIKGLAIKQTDNSIFVAINSGMSLTGISHAGAEDGHIGFGDLFFNFSDSDFQTASEQSSLFGVRFAATNDSGASQVGVYANVSAESVTLDNVGYHSLKQYYDQGFEKANTMGPDLATKEAVYSYFASNTTGENTEILNVMKAGTGTYVGGLELLNLSEMENLGLDFGYFNAEGTETVGFKFDRSLLPGGDFIAHLFVECGNDGVAISGTVQDVPEPSAMVGLALFGLVCGGGRLRRIGKIIG